MRLARLFPLVALFLLVSCFSAQAEDPVDGPQASSRILASMHKERTPATPKDCQRPASEPEHC